MAEHRYETSGPARETAPDCWLSEYLPAEVFALAWAVYYRELFGADERRTQYRVGRRG